MNTFHLTPCTTIINLSIPNITLRKLLFNLYMITSPLISLNMFLSLLTYIIIHWTSLSLLKLISSQQYYNLLLLYLFHFPIFTTINLTPIPPQPPKIIFHRTKNINIVKFHNELASSDLILHPPKALPKFLDSYDSTLRSILEKQALLITKLSKPH